jgi:single-strand DNA-binding protein
MSKSLNDICLTGYLGGDPRCHTFDDGSRVANLSLAVAHRKKQGDEYVDDTIWVDVKASAYADRTGAVDAIETYLAKGSLVAVQGELAQPREWTDKGGNTRFTIVIDHADVTFLGSKTDGGNGGGQPAQQQRQAAPAQQQAAVADDDIPF